MSLIKPTIKYSILCGVFLSGLFFVSLRFGSNPILDQRHFFFDLAVFFLFIFFAGKEYKDFRNGGILYFWQGISLGFIVLIPATLLFSIFLFVIFYQYPELIEQYREGAKSMVDAQKELYVETFGEEAIQDQYKQIESRQSIDLILRNSGWKVLTGFLVTPVVSIILRRKPN